MKASLTTLLILPLLFNFGMAQESESQSYAKIEFHESEFDFGEVTSGELVTHIYTFTNVGDEPLVITNAKGSCGCTVPFFPNVPVMPGETSEIQVEFHSEGKFGTQRKKIIVEANTSPSITMVSLSGNVRMNDGNELNNLPDHQQDLEALKSTDPNCIAIFPNPTNETLQLDLKEHIGRSAKVVIKTDLGVEILSEQIARISQSTTRFDVSSFTPGIYLIIITVDDEKPITQCFVVSGH